MSVSRTAQRLLRGSVAAVLTLSVLAFGPAPVRGALAATPYTLTDLGTLGGTISASTAINDLGQVIGQSTTADFATHSFLWTPGSGMVDLGTLGGRNTQALALSNAGHVVGWSDTVSGYRHAFIWTAEGGMVDLGTLGGAVSRAAAVNDNGRVVGWSETSDHPSHAFTWTGASGMVDLGAGAAMDVNNAGQVVGGADGAFLWTQGGGKVSLGTLGGVYGAGSAINERGEVTGTSQTAAGSSHPFFWTATGGMIDIGTLGGSFALPVAINGASQVAGWGPPASGVNHAFLWDATGGLVDLGTPGGSVTVQGMNDSGQVVGTAMVTSPTFATRMFSWTEPGGFVDFGPIGVPATVAVNAAGQIAANADLGDGQHAVVWSPAGIPPTITSPASTTFTVGIAATFTVTSSGSPTPAIHLEGPLPSGIEFLDRGDGTATLSGTPAPGTGGVYPLTITVVNGIAPDATQTLTLHVDYLFSGFFSPIRAQTLNVATAGRAIPIKFSLGGDQGLAIFANDSPRSTPVDCSERVAEDSGGAVETAGNSGLSYDADTNAPTGLYTYVWKTDQAWAGTCRLLQVTLSDEHTYTATFRFAR